MDDRKPQNSKSTTPSGVFGAPPQPTPLPKPPTDTAKRTAADARKAMPVRRRDTGTVKRSGQESGTQPLDVIPVDPSPPMLDSFPETTSAHATPLPPAPSQAPPPPPPPPGRAPSADPFAEDAVVNAEDPFAVQPEDMLATPSAPIRRPVSGRRPTTRITSSSRMRRAGGSGGTGTVSTASGRVVAVSIRGDQQETERLVNVQDRRGVGSTELFFAITVVVLLIGAGTILALLLTQSDDGGRSARSTGNGGNDDNDTPVTINDGDAPAGDSAAVRVWRSDVDRVRDDFAAIEARGVTAADVEPLWHLHDRCVALDSQRDLLRLDETAAADLADLLERIVDAEIDAALLAVRDAVKSHRMAGEYGIAEQIVRTVAAGKRPDLAGATIVNDPGFVADLRALRIEIEQERDTLDSLDRASQRLFIDWRAFVAEHDLDAVATLSADDARGWIDELIELNSAHPDGTPTQELLTLCEKLIDRVRPAYTQAALDALEAAPTREADVIAAEADLNWLVHAVRPQPWFSTAVGRHVADLERLWGAARFLSSPSTLIMRKLPEARSTGAFVRVGLMFRFVRQIEAHGPDALGALGPHERIVGAEAYAFLADARATGAIPDAERLAQYHELVLDLFPNDADADAAREWLETAPREPVRQAYVRCAILVEAARDTRLDGSQVHDFPQWAFDELLAAAIALDAVSERSAEDLELLFDGVTRLVFDVQCDSAGFYHHIPQVRDRLREQCDALLAVDFQLFRIKEDALNDVRDVLVKLR